MLKKVFVILFFPLFVFAQKTNTPIYVDSQNLLQFTSSNLPIIFINTNGQQIPNDDKITADMGVIYNGEGVRNNITDPFNHYNGKIGIEIRGSSSQMFPKKQYAIETRDASGEDLDVSLLGLPSESDWVLYAPYTDKSLMRNVLIYNLASSIGKYATRTKYFELVLNGNYVGLYTLFEKIKRDNNRVNIKKLDPDDISGDALTGGYILKIDKFSGENNEGWPSSYAPYAGAWQVLYYQYHIPKPTDIVSQQKEYIKNYIYQLETKMNSDNFNNPDSGYTTFLDVPSFVDVFLMNEISKNVDGYRLSAYMYKNRNSVNPKLFMGPIWDYNLAFGNADYYEGWEETGWMIDYQTSSVSFLIGDGAVPPFYWKKLKNDEYFANSVNVRWEDLKSTYFNFNYFNAKIDSLVVLLYESQARNFERWPVLGTYVWPNAYIGQTYFDEIIYLKSWIRDRLVWLNANMIGEYVSVEDEVIPSNLSLSQNYPNPFNPSTTINYSLNQLSLVKIEIYNTLGQSIYVAVDEEKDKGNYSISLDMSAFAGGVYFYRMSVLEKGFGNNALSIVKKMLYLK